MFTERELAPLIETVASGTVVLACSIGAYIDEGGLGNVHLSWLKSSHYPVARSRKNPGEERERERYEAPTGNSSN